MQNTICIIGVYFGNLPRYFDLWKKSAEYNKTIDFLIITDQEIDNLPSNIHMLSMTIEQMKSLAEKQINMSNISMKKPYKCCDFRPAFGMIFQDYIKQYMYWGHCDFDMIFGDLSSFFDRYDLYSYDKFLALGHLTLYRNTTENNMRYMCNGGKVDFKTVFMSDTHYAFDEVSGITQIYKNNGFSQFTKRIFCDIASIHYRYMDIEEYTLDEKAQNHRDQIYYWENGHIYRKWFDGKSSYKDEYIYIHFKKRPNFELTFDSDAANCFLITNTGFYSIQGEPDISFAKKYNKYHPLKEIKETVCYKLEPYWTMLRK